jgi:hypothetical protein
MGRRLKHYGIQTPGTTSIATTGNTDEYLIVPKSGRVAAALFSSLAALATSDTNYITFSITNLGQAGAGTTVMLAATDANTTKATGGSAIAANTKRTLTLNGTVTNLDVTEGDRLLVRFAATGTLAGAVTRPGVMILIAANGQ